MSGSITGSLQVKRGLYYAVVNLTGPDGKRKQRWIGTGLPERGNKRKAAQMLSEILADLEAQEIRYDSSMKFCELLELWLESCEGKIRESTYRNYKLVMDAHIIPYFKAKNIKARDLRPSHLEEYYKYKLKTLSPVTVQKHHANISSALEFGRKNRIINSNVAKDAWVPSRSKKQFGSFYTVEQLAKLKEVGKGSSIEVPLMLIIAYGFRRSEALGLKWDAVNLVKKEITIRATLIVSGTEVKFVEETKSEAGKRTLPISDELVEYLKDVRDRQKRNKAMYGNFYHDDGFVCTYEDGTVIHPEYLTRKFSALLEKNNLPHIRLHDLRHSAATNLLSMGFPVKDVSVWLGHADVSTTLNIYGHVLEESKLAMADALWSVNRSAV